MGGVYNSIQIVLLEVAKSLDTIMEDAEGINDVDGTNGVGSRQGCGENKMMIANEAKDFKNIMDSLDRKER